MHNHSIGRQKSVFLSWLECLWLSSPAKPLPCCCSRPSYSTGAAEARTHGNLQDSDRIFTNLYGR